MAGRDLLRELFRPIERRIDVPAEPLLRRTEGTHDLGEGDVAHHEDVHVAVALQLTPRRRTEDESGPDPVGERREGLADDVRDGGRLQQERAQLREDRALLVRLEVHMPTLDGPPEDPHIREHLQFPLHGSLRGSRPTHDLAEVEPLPGVAEQPAEHPLPRSAEEDRREVPAGRRGDRTHRRYDRTLFGYTTPRCGSRLRHR